MHVFSTIRCVQAFLGEHECIPSTEMPTHSRILQVIPEILGAEYIDSNPEMCEPARVTNTSLRCTSHVENLCKCGLLPPYACSLTHRHTCGSQNWNVLLEWQWESHLKLIQPLVIKARTRKENDNIGICH